MNRITSDEFVRLVNSNIGIINSICKMFHPVAEDQKDARQDIIVELWRSVHRFRNESRFSTWVYKISLNTMIKRSRKNKKGEQFYSIDNVRESLFVSKSADDDVALLYQIVGQLQPKDKALMILFLEGYNYDEIAAIMDISSSNVGTRLCRIKNKIKANFKSINSYVGKL